MRLPVVSHSEPLASSASLPRIDAHAANVESCAFCPKLCRAACPVADADARETSTPWGAMSAMFLLARGAVPATPSHAAPAWSCTGCMGCRSSCDLKNDVAATLVDARADLFAAGLAPSAATRIVHEFAEKSRAAHEGLARAVDHATRRGAQVRTASVGGVRPRGATALVVGCMAARAAAADGSGSAADAIMATSALARTDGLAGGKDGAAEHFRAHVEVVERCCGAPLAMAGDRAGFVRSAEALARALDGYADVVVADAGCAHNMISRAPAAGVVGCGAPIRHLSQLAFDRLATLPALTDAARAALGDGAVRYHDACSLGRGLGIYDAPRAVLTKLLGRAPDEFARAREHATCAGAGGALPLTARESSREIARERLRQHAHAGGGVVVTTCPSSRRNFAREGGEAFDLATLIARAVEGA